MQVMAFSFSRFGGAMPHGGAQPTGGNQHAASRPEDSAAIRTRPPAVALRAADFHREWEVFRVGGPSRAVALSRGHGRKDESGEGGVAGIHLAPTSDMRPLGKAGLREPLAA
jgi:hypothetical protein